MDTKNKTVIAGIFLLVFIFTSALLPKDITGYKILHQRGTVKIKQDDRISVLNAGTAVSLGQGDAVMAYKEASVKIVFPGGRERVLEGPFYAAVETLDVLLPVSNLAFFEDGNRWKSLETIFNKERNPEDERSRGTMEDSLDFYGNARSLLSWVDIKDETLAPNEMQKMADLVKTADKRFGAFPKEKQAIIRAMIYKTFGLYKKAVTQVLSQYETMLRVEGKQAARELMEDQLKEKFFPVVVFIRPLDSKERVDSRSRVRRFTRQFTSKFKLWWASYYYNGKDLILIETTIDTSVHPQKIYRVIKDFPVEANKGSKQPAACFFVIASADWKQVEKLDNMEETRRALLEAKVRETRTQSVMSYDRVIIKLCHQGN